MKRILFILVLICVAASHPAHARGTQASLMPPLFQELKDEGVKVSWRGRTGCCELWVLTAPTEKVMWLSTDKKLDEVTFLDMDGRPLEPEAIRKHLGMDKN